MLGGTVSQAEIQLLLLCYNKLTISSLAKQYKKHSVKNSIKRTIARVRHGSGMGEAQLIIHRGIPCGVETIVHELSSQRPKRLQVLSSFGLTKMTD